MILAMLVDWIVYCLLERISMNIFEAIYGSRDILLLSGYC